MTFTTDNITITQRIQNYFNNHIVPLLPQLKNYQLAIDGSISSGKSTSLEHLLKLFNEVLTKENLQVIPEYLNAEPIIGPMLLDKFITKEITNSTFQNFILDCYHSTVKNLNNDFQLRLFERIPDDSILIFANLTNFNTPEDLDEFALYHLYNKMIKYDKIDNYPSYLDDETKFIKIQSCSIEDVVITILSIIKSDIEQGIKKRIIGLNVDISSCIIRIQERGRECEAKYTSEYLNGIIKTYEKIFNKKEHSKMFKFTNLGELIN